MSEKKPIPDLTLERVKPAEIKQPQEKQQYVFLNSVKKTVAGFMLAHMPLDPFYRQEKPSPLDTSKNTKTIAAAPTQNPIGVHSEVQSPFKTQQIFEDPFQEHHALPKHLMPKADE